MGDEELRGSGVDTVEPSIFDGLSIGARTGRFTRSTEMSDLPREEAYAEINDELYRLTGKRLPNPVTQDRLRVGGIRNGALGQSHPENTERQWLEELTRLTSPTRVDNVGGELRPVDPRVRALITRALPDAITRRADELMRAAAEEGARYNETFGFWGMLISGIGDLAGNIAAGDPTAIASVFAGGGAARTVLGTVGREAVAGAIGTAVSEYATAVGAERLGQPYTFKDFLLNTAIGGTISGGLGAGGHVVGDAMSGNLGRPRPGPYDSPAPILTAPPEDTVREVAAGLRAAKSNVEREVATEAVVARRTSLIEPEEEAFRAVDEADSITRDLGEEPEPPAVVRETTPEETASAARVADEAPAPAAGDKIDVTFRGVTRPITFERVRPGSIGFAPQEFQYKKSSGPQGQTGTLEGVQTFDPVSSGKVLVFERANGERVIGDGHQRLSLAQRAEAAGQDVTLDAFIYREADGFAANDVRQIAAQKNLREGAGDPLDVAAILREAPDLLDSSMPLGGVVMRTGRALSRMADEALGAVRNGLISPEHGAVIARVLGDHPELQMPAVKQFMEDPPRNEGEATFIAREMAALPAHREAAAQMGLFGDAPLISGARERGAILAAAQAALRNDKRAFAAANRFADDLEKAGNVLAKEENARRAGAANALLREIMTLSTRAGPVADTLRRITAAAIEAKTSAKVAGQQFADEIMVMLDERGLLGLKTDAPAVAVPAPEPAPMHDLLDVEVRAAEIVHAQDLDDVALRGAMAEAAVERAMRGDQPPAFADDALGLTPESDLAAIDRALADMEALGEPVDPTMREAAAAFLADADDDLMADARARLAPKNPAEIDEQIDKPASLTEAVEAREIVDAPFHPLDFDDEVKLRVALDGATMPELAAVAADFGVDPRGSRAMVTAAILGDFNSVGSARFAGAPRGWTHIEAGPPRIDSTPAQLTTVLEKRFGKKTVTALLASGKLNIVATGADLPIFKVGGKFAMEMASPQKLQGMIDSGDVTVVMLDDMMKPKPIKVKERDRAGATTYSTMVDGKRLNIALDRRVGDTVNVAMALDGRYSSGTGGLSREARQLGFRTGREGSVSDSLQVFGLTIAAIRHDVSLRTKPMTYTFAGGDMNLTGFYARMMTMKGILPDGYRAFVRSPDGTFHVIPAGVDPARFGDTMQPITKETMFAREAGGISGYHLDGQSYIDASVVTPERASAIVLHEVGVHAGMENMIGAEAWAGVLAHVERMVAAGDEDFAKARAYVLKETGTPPHQLTEETLAWGVTHYEQLREGSGFKGLIDRVIASVRAWLWKTFPGTRERFGLTMADYHALAVGALRREAMTPLATRAPAPDPLRVNIAEQQLADSQRLNEIAEMLKDCAP